MTRFVQNALILDGRAAAMLWTRLNLHEQRIRARDNDQAFYALLVDIYRTAAEWHVSGAGSATAPSAEPSETERQEHTTPEEVAERMNVTARTVRNAIARGDLPAVKRGTVWLINRTDADAFVESRKSI